MKNNKSLGNDGLSKELFKYFWDEIKKLFLTSIHKAFLSHELSSSQKQAVITILEKKTKTIDLLRTQGWYHCLIQI